MASVTKVTKYKKGEATPERLVQDLINMSASDKPVTYKTLVVTYMSGEVKYLKVIQEETQ